MNLDKIMYFAAYRLLVQAISISRLESFNKHNEVLIDENLSNLYTIKDYLLSSVDQDVEFVTELKDLDKFYSINIK